MLFHVPMYHLLSVKRRLCVVENVAAGAADVRCGCGVGRDAVPFDIQLEEPNLDWQATCM